MEDWDTDWEDGEERAKWITERAGVFADRDIAKIDIGEVKDGMLHVREEYGGGVISLKKARKIVNEHMYAGNLAGSPTMQKRIKEAFAGRGIECECNLLSEAAKGGAQGIAEGATVEVDYATLGWVPSLHKKSLEIQADAANNGDVLSQIGYGLGKVGIDTGYTVVGLKAGSLVGRGAARVAPRLVGTLNKAKPVLQTVGIVTGTVDTVGHSYCSYEAFRAGDYNTGTHMLGRSLLSGILTGATIKDTFGTRPRGGIGPVQKGEEGVRLSRRAAVARGEIIEGNQVTLDVRGSRIRTDLVSQTKAGNWRVIEAKNGPFARLTRNQRIAYEMLTNGAPAVPVGRNAVEAGLPVGEEMPFDVLIDWWNR